MGRIGRFVPVEQVTAQQMKQILTESSLSAFVKYKKFFRTHKVRLQLADELAEKLAAGLPHVRVDLYNIAGKPYFGELTFYTGGGFDPFYAEEERPDRLDRELGELFVLQKQDE